MTTTAPANPLVFRSEFEHVGLDESETIHALQTVFANMAKKVADLEGHASRAVHAKGHALVRGKLTVLDNWPRACSARPAPMTCCCDGRRHRQNSCRTASRPTARWR
jgi:hypothetical protein